MITVDAQVLAMLLAKIVLASAFFGVLAAYVVRWIFSVLISLVRKHPRYKRMKYLQWVGFYERYLARCASFEARAQSKRFSSTAPD